MYRKNNHKFLNSPPLPWPVECSQYIHCHESLKTITIQYIQTIYIQYTLQYRSLVQLIAVSSLVQIQGKLDYIINRWSCFRVKGLR